jgi:hypothetical protein
MISTIYKNLLKSSEELIVQQCNCVSINAKGLSKSISDTFPYGNIYTERKCIDNKNIATIESRDIPGSVRIKRPHIQGPIIAFLMAQWNIGKPGQKYYNKEKDMDKYDDTAQNRLIWFTKCLNKLGKWCILNNIKTVGFPYKIGCGLAGGSWNLYLDKITIFACQYAINVNIYNYTNKLT